MRAKTEKKLVQATAAIAQGTPIQVACKAVGLATETYRRYRRSTPRPAAGRLIEIPVSTPQAERVLAFWLTPSQVQQIMRGEM